MTGAGALKIWQRAIQPVCSARDEAKKEKTPAAFAKFDGARETLRAIKLSLIEAVVRDEDGALSQIARDWAELERDFFTLPIISVAITGVRPEDIQVPGSGGPPSIITTEGCS